MYGYKYCTVLYLTENGEGAFLRRFAFPLFSAGRIIAFKKALPKESFFLFSRRQNLINNPKSLVSGLSL